MSSSAPIKDNSNQPTASEIEHPAPETSARILVYVLQGAVAANGGRMLAVGLQSVAVAADGSLGEGQHYTTAQILQPAPADYITPTDRAIADLLGNTQNSRFILTGPKAEQILLDIIRTKRAFWQNYDKPRLFSGPPMAGDLQWQTESGDKKSLIFWAYEMETFLQPFPLSPPYGIDPVGGTVHRLETDFSRDMTARLLATPTMTASAVDAVERQLKLLSRAHNMTPIPPSAFKQMIVLAETPVPMLVLSSVVLSPKTTVYGTMDRQPITRAVAFLSFDYQGKIFPSHSLEKEFNRLEGDTLVTIRRDQKAEKKAIDSLRKAGLEPLRSLTSFGYRIEENIGHAYTAAINPMTGSDIDVWMEFQDAGIPALRQQDWRITINSQFPYQFVLPDLDSWYGDITETSGMDWFDVSLGIELEGQKIELLPILIDMLRNNPPEFLDDFEGVESLSVRLDDGRFLMLPASRMLPILRLLKDLFSSDGTLKINRYDAIDLVELQAATAVLGMRWYGDQKLFQLGRKLKNFQGVMPVPPPVTLLGTLRPYQQDGLNWLVFLRDYGLAGILADDMGLGKTIQTLAYIASEKEQGRLTKPVLVVAPTSLMYNWQNEAAKFCPTLTVVLLHGQARKQHFDAVAGADLVLTTYALLPRDKDELLQHAYHTVILDEAQYIKNSKSKFNSVACQLKSDHRFCLTGTPLENHLGELWSLYNFLMPGVLGTENQFRQFYRTPIEKHGDNDRRQALARKLKPFLLRRTKDLVATELPPKTVIIQHSELEKQQRDLYETVRLAMDKKVREALADKGLARSHIVVLEALLKLRQVCCDPQLLKDTAIKKGVPSAKLEMLMDMLPEMIEEGRKILLFSQFTEMLGLIEGRLNAEKIPYVKLTGQTKDRASPIESFQNGEVPLFLISLKAGGTGLNLTAADTVIHYDPWWNPAAENQATDRAHRLGQDKPVFVYKLVAKGTVEEKILLLQEKKSKIAAGIYGDDAEEGGKLSADDISLLFSKDY